VSVIQQLHKLKVDAMNDHQVHGLLLLAAGLAVLIVSLVAAWTMTRRSRSVQVDGAGLIAVVSFSLFVVGLVICWYGVSAVLGV
jgi:hypothetical protein